MSSLAAAAAQHAGELAAKAAIRAATLAQSALAERKAKIRAAAHAAVAAAERTERDHSMRAAVAAAAATQALADAIGDADTSPDAQEVRTQARESARAIVSTLISASQSLFTALRELSGNLAATHAAGAPHFAEPVLAHVTSVAAATTHALEFVQEAAQLLGGSVNGLVGSPPTDAVDRVLASVRGVINDGRALVAELLRSGVTGADHVAATLRANLDHAEAALEDLAGAAGAGIAVGGVATLAVIIGVLLAFAHKS